MAHFAKIDENNIVVNILKVPDEEEYRGEEYLNAIGFEGRWIQTSYNTFANEHKFGDAPLRANYAVIGGVYNEEYDVFHSQRPNDQVILNTTTFMWEYPIPVPDYDKTVEIPRWNKVTQQWDIIQLNDIFPQNPTQYILPKQKAN
jgi:hypothetical protein